ncbi:MAG: lipopolysaccharide biosynthesis protein [Caldilineae bacterium]|nr:MAG: lipopolysaccharide biosynthesis protein [Caldilineae bacterium]
MTLAVALLSAVQLRPWQTPPPTYTATLRMLIGVLPVEGADPARYDPRYYAWLTSEYLVDDFTEVVASERFAAGVNRRLADQGISIPSGLIRGSATTGKQHRIIHLNLTWGDPAQLEAIAQAAAVELEENAAAYFSQLGTEDALVSLLDPPAISVVPLGVRSRLEWPLRVILALVAGVGLAFLAEYLDGTVRRAEDLEAVGAPVLGVIPKK